MANKIFIYNLDVAVFAELYQKKKRKRMESNKNFLKRSSSVNSHLTVCNLKVLNTYKCFAHMCFSSFYCCFNEYICVLMIVTIIIMHLSKQ